MSKRKDGQRQQDRAAARELVGTVLGTVRYADDGPPAEDALEAGASMLAAAPAGPEAVGAALLAAAEDAVRRCWQGGWQPADLERIVRRETGGGPCTAVVVDAMAAEAQRAGRAAERARGPRWAAQLSDLEAHVWWAPEPGYLEELARRRRSSRFETAYDVLAALRVLARLPRITPLPAARPVRAHTPAESRTLGRIRGLLAKAEATDYPEEAEALSAKAQELMARHSIDEALLDHAGADAGSGTGRTTAPAAVRIGIEGPYEQAKALLLDAVAAANRCQAVWSGDVGFSTLIGFEADLEAAELLYTSLLLQATTAMHRAGDAHHSHGRSRRTRDFRQTFLVAYADRIRTRLTAATDEATTEAATTTPALLPVLAAREVAVARTTDDLFPETAAIRMRGVRDAAGWEQGRAAADRARLGNRREG
ncbi:MULTISPECIES: DUF2786 domain-containing protein [Actinomycetes]|uniref:DUF2786 domain-containing protein n=1 Tax=Streptomyces rimosus subsp. rimosus TaxID=132474 RepID=A0ABY3Z0K3_STRRM|nr:MULTISPECIES: DUF2786 domain-containing protein [Streptomyces]KEF19570.1 hypothetical protein DF18_15945 [Streptomyces rimosus]UNZ03391.1 hypothetical protein SRIMR7_14635 [Streptomyces rimosus subsp. rimosus]UTH94937.1 hypothetical protein SRIMHP_12465 [Streptomyces rimosus subsp. rimosus]UTJ13034.1 hypothetical protein SRIMDV3_12360 [Streptomyces rimosus subsp. rimosus]